MYILYELNNRSRSPTSNFTLKIFLFGTVKLTRNVGKSKLSNNGQETAFDGKDIWSYGNDFARNVLIFDVDNTSSSRTNDGNIRRKTNQGY